MQTSQDKMTVNKQNINDSQKLLELYDQLDQVDSKDQVAIIQNEIRNVTDAMRKNGSWSYQADPNRDQLQGIIMITKNNMTKIINSIQAIQKN